MNNRFQALRSAMAERGLAALWISTPNNVRYITGFTHADDGRALVTPDQVVLYTDGRYIAQAKEDAFEGVTVHIDNPKAAIEHAAGLLPEGKVGIEDDNLTVAFADLISKTWNRELESTAGLGGGGLVNALRQIKDDEELRLIREAAALADRVWAEVSPNIKAGVKESEIAGQIAARFQEAGAGHAFETIVASGPRGAFPHGTASERVMQDGELVTVDFGAYLNGYNSDMTRTVAIGEPSAELVRMYNAVLEAQEAATKAVRPGVSCAELDEIARDVLEKHGLAQHFTHSLGHGVGSEVHEEPRLYSMSEDILKPGMVVTTEPGVYIEGVGGIRIEDLVLVTESGHDVLSSSPKWRPEAR